MDGIARLYPVLKEHILNELADAVGSCSMSSKVPSNLLSRTT